MRRFLPAGADTFKVSSFVCSSDKKRRALANSGKLPRQLKTKVVGEMTVPVDESI